MKFAVFIVLALLIGLQSFSQPPSKKVSKTQAPSPMTNIALDSTGIPFNDTLQQASVTVKVKYYLDEDSLGYVSVHKGYLIKTRTFSKKVQQLQSESSELFDDKWAKVDPKLVMNVREFDW